LNDQLKTKQQTEAELNKKSNEIAQEYSTMQPNQAANIISNMSLQDADFTLSAMKPQQRAAILAKMDSKKAADITSSLKDFTITQDNQIKNLQDKLQKLTDNKQTLDEIVKTYSQMPAPNAAKLISQIMKTDQKKAILLMSQMDTATRAQIISALSTDKTNPDGVNQAALLMKSLM
jgi:flagellar motility protein MotE (MotC chaperone)